MKTWIALFRGINVGGRNILPMKELTRLLEDCRCSCVQTYIQSGNAVFRSDRDGVELAECVSGGIEKQHGFKPEILLLTEEQLETAIGVNPFDGVLADPKSLHLYFLQEPPLSPDNGAIEALRAESEKYFLTGEVFYLYAPDGIGRSKLAAKAEKLIGVKATARNWRTVGKLHEMVGSA